VSTVPYVRDRRDLDIYLREHLTYCPRCGGMMVLIMPKRNQFFEPFYGCADYDIGCRGSREIGLDGEPVEEGDWWWME